MPSNDPTFLERQITWQFHVSRRENRVRYGTYGSFFYKQFLPGGIVISGQHQPRKIPLQLYQMAEKRRVEQ